MGYAEIFIKRLRERSQAQDDTFASEWVYAGGSEGSNYNYFKIRFPGKPVPAQEFECLCTHPIQENCYIENLFTGELVVVGNCCIEKFLPEDHQHRTCGRCNQPHKNRKDNYCNACREVMIDVGKYAGKFFDQVDDVGYQRWVLREVTGGTGSNLSLTNFKNYLLNKYGSYEAFEAAHPPPPTPAGHPDTVLDMGKHKGKTFEEAKGDKRYVTWVKNTDFTNTTSTLAVFKQWLLNLE